MRRRTPLAVAVAPLVGVLLGLGPAPASAGLVELARRVLVVPEMSPSVYLPRSASAPLSPFRITR